jgi:hypothetical protein
MPCCLKELTSCRLFVPSTHRVLEARSDDDQAVMTPPPPPLLRLELSHSTHCLSFYCILQARGRHVANYLEIASERRRNDKGRTILVGLIFMILIHCVSFCRPMMLL